MPGPGLNLRILKGQRRLILLPIILGGEAAHRNGGKCGQGALCPSQLLRPSKDPGLHPKEQRDKKAEKEGEWGEGRREGSHETQEHA
jgi:hypothetical protein